MNSFEEDLAALNESALLADGFDEAIIGWGAQATNDPVVIYNYDKCVEILMANQDWDHEEAIEWMEYNVVSSYMGKGTPIFMKPDQKVPDE